MFDADPRWVTYPEPTPDLTNDPSSCGTRRFGGRSTGHHPYSLSLAGRPRIGTTPHVVLTGGPPRRTMFWPRVVR